MTTPWSETAAISAASSSVESTAAQYFDTEGTDGTEDSASEGC